MFEDVKMQVAALLKGDDSGHGMDHILRVLDLSMAFLEKEEKQYDINRDVTALIALLHDVDDYKLVGSEQAGALTNARSILTRCNIREEIQGQVLAALGRMGYSNYLIGLRPTSAEGQLVSDADMCDSLGANGILRVYQYSSKKGRPFFDKRYLPRNSVDASAYKTQCADSSVCHIFEKLLKLPNLMFTDAGKKEARIRHMTMTDFLYRLFEEENAPEWTEYLNQFLNAQNPDQHACT